MLPQDGPAASSSRAVPAGGQRAPAQIEVWVGRGGQEPAKPVWSSPGAVMPLETAEQARAEGTDGPRAKSSKGKNLVIPPSQFGHKGLRTN